MTLKQRAVYAMVAQIILFFKKYTTELKHISALAPLLVLLDKYIEKIDSLKLIQGTDITGLAKQKQKLREKAAHSAYQVSRGIVAFAKVNNNNALAQEAYYPESELGYMRDDDFDIALRVIDNSLTLYKDNIIEFGVTLEMIDTFIADKNSYTNYIAVPKQGSLQRKQATGQIGAETDSVMETMDKIDLLMDTIRYTNPEIYAEYADNRKLVVRAGTISAKIKVVDAATLTALNGAHVEIKLGRELIAERTTAEGGVLLFKSLDENTYNVTVSKIGYQTVTLPFDVSDSDLNQLDVQLGK